MLLTCPHCTTRYQVEEANFPPAGRTVRCGKCRHSWHQPGFVAEFELQMLPRSITASKTQTLAANLPACEAIPHGPESLAAQFALRAQPVGRKPFGNAAPVAGWATVVAAILLVVLLIKH